MKLGAYELLVRFPAEDETNLFLARSAEHGLVTIEMLKPSLAARPEHVTRMFAKARAGASMVHPNILKTIAFTQQNGVHCLVRQFLHGVRASELAKHGPIPDDVGLGILHCATIAMVHARSAFIAGSIADHVILGFDGPVRLFGFEEGEQREDAIDLLAKELAVSSAAAARPMPSAIAPYVATIFPELVEKRDAVLDGEPVSVRDVPSIPGGATHPDPLQLFSPKLRAPPPMEVTGFAPLPLKRDDEEG